MSLEIDLINNITRVIEATVRSGGSSDLRRSTNRYSPSFDDNDTYDELRRYRDGVLIETRYIVTVNTKDDILRAIDRGYSVVFSSQSLSILENMLVSPDTYATVFDRQDLQTQETIRAILVEYIGRPAEIDNTLSVLGLNPQEREIILQHATRRSSSRSPSPPMF